jgi:hypothetical protein
MNDWMRINRIRGPVYILTAGVLGLLAEFTRYGWGRTWPVWIIVTGVLMFAQHNARRSAIESGEIPGVPPVYPPQYPPTPPGTEIAPPAPQQYPPIEPR